MATISHHSYQMAPPGAPRPAASERLVDPGRVRSMLEALDHDRLLDLVTDLVVRQPIVYGELRAMLRSDPTQRRLFVRGLSRNCTNQDLTDAFSVYGQVDEAVVMKQKGTQCCKGFGFVTFADAMAADAAMQQPEKLIAGRMAITSLAALGNRNKSAPIAAGYPTASASYAATQFEPQTATNIPSYLRPASGNPHKRYREQQPAPSSIYYDVYKSLPPPQNPSNNHLQYQQSYYHPSQRADPYRKHQEPSYSKRMAPYSDQLR